ncbi:MAG: protein-L-isoaspartate O-methyltransferase [Rhizobiaceae bacterium]
MLSFQDARTKMVDCQLRTTDVTNPAILDAMGTVARERFVPEARAALAYIDEDIALNGSRFLMEPSPFAKLLQLANPQSGDKVLIVGAGTGYSAAVAATFAASVTALECDASLAAAARENLSAQPNVTVAEGQLAAGWAANAPYDVILVEGAVSVAPEKLFGQLAEGGRLVEVSGTGNAGVANLHVNTGGRVSGRRGFNAAVRPLPGFAREESFVF